MAEQILQINFKFNVAAAEYRKLAQEIAGAFAEVEGLRWKVWILGTGQGPSRAQRVQRQGVRRGAESDRHHPRADRLE
jgi:hypothetical protein